MDLFEAIEQRSSVREFVPVEVPEADVERIIDAGRRAPSGMNAQPVRYIVIRNRETLERLGQVQSCIAQVTCAIAIVSDPSASDYWLEDAAAAAENMLLAVKALGYDSVWIQGTLRKKEKAARRVLGVPDGLELLILLPIGRAKVRVPQRARKPLSELIHRERW